MPEAGDYVSVKFMANLWGDFANRKSPFYLLLFFVYLQKKYVRKAFTKLNHI